MAYKALVIAAVYWQLVVSSHGQRSTPTVIIPGVGSVQGSIEYSAWTNRTIYQFHSIPYAEPPTGELRFRAPVKRTAWTATRNVSQPGVQCPQIVEEYTNVDNEDCLTLSVFTNELNALRPVMVFIHGGAFFYGSAKEYPPHYLLESNIVLVVIQYRLGPLGFLSLLNERIPGNAGILDMILALEWVQQHIVQFGGNASAVTVFGESAGSAAVSTLLHSPILQNRIDPLFHRAILQSGSVFAAWAMSDTPVEGSLDIARRAGCLDESVVEQCLQQLPIKTLLEAFSEHRDDMISTQSYPNVAGAGVVVGGPSGVFPQHPKSYLWNANKNIPIMGGANSEEGLFLLDMMVHFVPDIINHTSTSQGLLQFARLIQEKTDAKLDGALEGYAIMGTFLTDEFRQVEWKTVVPGLVDLCSVHGFKGPLMVDIHAFSAVNPDNVYLYSFDFPSEAIEHVTNFPFPYEGAIDHGDELYYLFPMSTLNERDTRMAKIMVELWTSFATQGKPNAKDVPYWLPASELYGPYLKIDEQIEQRNNYLNEFTAASTKYRANGGTQLNISIVAVVFLTLITKLV